MNNEGLKNLCALIIPAGDSGEPSGADSSAAEYIAKKLSAANGPGHDARTLISTIVDTEDLSSEALTKAEAANPESFAAIVKLVYEGYYTDPTVVEKLALPQSPQPAGHTMESFNETLLEPVKTRK